MTDHIRHRTLNCNHRLSDQSALFGGKGAQNKLHLTHIWRRAANAYADASEICAPEGTQDGLHTPVTTSATRGSDANLPRSEVHIIVDDEQILKGRVKAKGDLNNSYSLFDDNNSTKLNLLFFSEI